MTAIYKRELRAYFTTVTGWLFVAAQLCLAGLYFFVVNLLSGYGNVAQTVSSILFLLLLTTPVLAMRILAEERKQKTDQLILTSPVSIAGIVCGKYLAMATVFTIPVAVMALFPLILRRYGSVAMQESYTAILVYYLFGLACLSICLFLSSLTESQVIAAVLSFAVLFIGYMMSGIRSLISENGNLLTKALGAFDFSERLNAMLGGTLDGKAVLYFLTIIGVFLFFTTQSIQKRRYQMSVKTIRFGAYSLGMVALVLVVAVFLNLAVGELPDRYTTLDVTDEGLYSLTDTTKNVLAGLQEDVTIYVLQSEKEQDSVLGATLDSYANLSEHIHVVYRDPVTTPDFYRAYTDSVSLNSLIVESDKRFRVVDYSDIYEQTYDYTYYTSEITGYDAEGQLTGAIVYVTGDSAPVLYELNGHDELALSDTFVDSAKKENVDLAELTLLTQEAVPEDANGVLMMAPTMDLGEDDADKLLAYLEQGGTLFLETRYTDAFSEQFPNLSGILKWFGLSVADGLIVDPDSSHMYQTPIYLLPEVRPSTLTEGVYGSSYPYILMPYAQPILSDGAQDVSVTELLSTSESAYAKTGLEENDALKQEEGDRKGPFPVGVEAVKELSDEKQARLILYSSEMLFTDSTNQYTMNNNLTLFSNAVASMAGQEESVSVPVKSYESYYLTVSAGSAVRLGIFFIGLLPILCLICGIVIWARRRKRG